MKKRVILFSIAAVCIIILLAVALAINKSNIEKYNETFPEEYITDNYPNAEIISSHSEGDSILTAPCEKYLCYDSDKHFAFTQKFMYSGSFSKLAPYNDNSKGYNSMMKHREAFDRCINSIPEYFDGEHFARYNPDNISGILIFARLKDVNALENLADGLYQTVIDEEAVSHVFVSYSIYMCSDELYEKLESFDYETLVHSEEFMDGNLALLSIEAVTLMSGNEFVETGEFGFDCLPDNADKLPSGTDVLMVRGGRNTLKGNIKIRLFSKQ